jgi:glycosyltransferase involved in cell wall biosynthesis
MCELNRMKASSKHVLMLLENFSYPQDVRVRRESRALIAAGYRVSVICPAAAGQPRRETIDSVQVYRFPAPPEANGFAGYAWEYLHAIVAMFLISLVVWVREPFDVVHTANPPDLLVFVAGFYKLLGKRFVYDHHDLAPEMYRARFSSGGRRVIYKVLLWLEKLSCRFADRVIATNESYKRIEMQRDGVPEPRVSIVRNGPDLQPLPPQSISGFCKDEKTVIGYAGMIGPQDGLDYLVRSLHHLRCDFGRKDFQCVIVGNGQALSGIKALARELGVEEQIWFAGWISDVEEFRRYLLTFDICIAPEPSNPYNDCSTMIKIVDYMAVAKPIIAFDLPEHRFSAKDAAIYVPDNDVRQFARAIAELMDDPPRRKQMGLAGRKRVETELAWCYSVPLLLDAYRALDLETRHGAHPQMIDNQQIETTTMRSTTSGSPRSRPDRESRLRGSR